MLNGIIDGLYRNKYTQRYIKWTEKPAEKSIRDLKITTNLLEERLDQPTTHYSNIKKIVPPILMSWLSLVQCGFFAKSKEMPEDKKSSLICSEFYTIGFGIAGGLALDKTIDKVTKKFVKQAEIVYAKHSKEEKQMLREGIEVAIPAAFSVVLFQYLGAVLAAPLATKTTQILIKHGIVKPKSNTNISK